LSIEQSVKNDWQGSVQNIEELEVDFLVKSLPREPVCESVPKLREAKQNVLVEVIQDQICVFPVTLSAVEEK
jgi:hypothetical protein